MNVAKMIDHSLLRPELTTDDIRAGCEIAGRRDVASVCVRPSDVAAAQGHVVKVILENAYLSDEQKIAGCRIAEQAGAHFVKTSTGFAPGGASLADIQLMRAAVSPHIQVKAAGGVRTLDILLTLHDAGATRFGATATEAILDDGDY